MNVEKAIVAGGCFWCVESAFHNIPGVITATSGYIGGVIKSPTYDEVCSGTSGHYEAVEVMFDASQISYEEVLNIFWRTIDPTDDGGQFADRGSQYQSAIFYLNDEQRKIAEKSKKKLGESGLFKDPIVVEILKADKFYPAEEYHQKYSQKQPEHYQRYSVGSGRADFIEQVWDSTSKVCPIRFKKK